jgi:hypothetical protein
MLIHVHSPAVYSRGHQYGGFIGISIHHGRPQALETGCPVRSAFGRQVTIEMDVYVLVLEYTTCLTLFCADSSSTSEYNDVLPKMRV